VDGSRVREREQCPGTRCTEQLRFVPDLKPVIDRRDPCDELDLERRGDQDDRTKPRLCVPEGSWVRPGARMRSVSLLPRSDSDVAGTRKRDLAAHELLTGFPLVEAEAGLRTAPE